MGKDVSNPSLDYNAMRPYWDKVDAILGGTETMRAASQYLPKFPNESQKDYDFRLSNAKFTNVFGDVLEGLAAKPFAEEVKVDDQSSTKLERFIEDVDGQGNHIHVFAANTFYNGLGYGYDWIFVDYTRTERELRSRQDEKEAGVRPYWVGLRATDVIAVETARINGREEFTHLRFYANTVEREGYEEKVVQRIREFNREKLGDDRYGPATYKTWEKDSKENKWLEVDGLSGTLTIGIIPLVPFVSARRNGTSWKVHPLLAAAADLQIVLYQDESGMRNAKNNTAFPMLAANGVEPAVDDNGKPSPVPVGPMSVLYAPPSSDGSHGEWTFIEPSATSLNFLKDDNEATIEQIRELGRQAMTRETGNMTNIMASQSAAKGNSAVKAAALLLKDALENALKITAMWMKLDIEPEVQIFTDFEIELSGNEDLATLREMRTAGEISLKTYWRELRRRNVLSENFDDEEEQNALDEELPGDDDDNDIIDAGLNAADADADAA